MTLFAGCSWKNLLAQGSRSEAGKKKAHPGDAPWLQLVPRSEAAGILQLSQGYQQFARPGAATELLTGAECPAVRGAAE